MKTPKTAEEHDYEHIVGMSQEFDGLNMEQVSQQKDYWMLRILLAGVQQLSVISATLKERDS